MQPDSTLFKPNQPNSKSPTYLADDSPWQQGKIRLLPTPNLNFEDISTAQTSLLHRQYSGNQDGYGWKFPWSR